MRRGMVGQRVDYCAFGLKDGFSRVNFGGVNVSQIRARKSETPDMTSHARNSIAHVPVGPCGAKDLVIWA